MEEKTTPLEEIETAEEAAQIDPEVVEAVETALAEGRDSDAAALASDLAAADQSDLIEGLDEESRARLIDALGSALEPEALAFLDPTVREGVIEHIGADRLAALLSQMESDDAVAIFADLEDEAQSRILAKLPAAYRRMLVEGATFEEGTAGRLMQREAALVPAGWSVGETIDFMRTADHLPDDFTDLFAVDPQHRLVGVVPLSRLLRAKRPAKIGEIAEAERLKPVPLTMDQAEVADLFRRFALSSAPVVDEAGRLVGVITADDVLEVVDEEAEDDLMKLGGVTETDVYQDVLATARARLPWLAVNLITAVIASLVIGFFEDTLAQVVALAVLMPIVASMGGNAGTQTLTIAVRALATHDLSEANARRMVVKELIVGAINGLVFALVTGAVAWGWYQRPELGLVIGAAMICNQICAGLAGIAIPLALQRMKIDPAIASTVFLTTVTDVVGFFAFLGLATLFLL